MLALAGVFQGVALAQQLANEGHCDDAALASSIASVFRIDAPDVVGVFGAVTDVRLGLRTLVGQMDGSAPGGRDANLMRMAATVLRLERTFSGRRVLQQHLQEGIIAAQRQVDHFGQGHPTVVGRLANLYTEVISPLRPRVLVAGQPLHLKQQAVVDRIRAALLASIRAAVLWHQIGGRQWHLLLRRRQWMMLARGLLTRATLDQG